MRRVALVIVVAVVLVFAGCIGLSGEDVNQTDDLDANGADDIVEDTGDVERETESEDGSGQNVTTDVDGDLEIHHIDVGQADATLMITPDNETVLIDTGDWRQDGTVVIEYLEAKGIERIDHLIATHAHADHIGGHARVIEHFETNREGIGAAYDSGVVHTSLTYENYLDAVDEHDVDLIVLEEGDDVPLETTGLSATVLNPSAGDSGTDLHYNSLSIVFEFGEIRYLTTGDAEADAEERMLEDWDANLSADIYHAGHHGSATSSTEPFFTQVDPSVAIISSNYDSQYGHPHDEVLERFATMDIETYWTGVHGTIVVTTDGETISTTTDVDDTTDPDELREEKPDEETPDEETPAIISGPVVEDDGIRSPG